MIADLAVVSALFALFVWFSVSRLVAQDEGFYLFAAKLVVRGQLPYLDFFYPQMPALPYLYGAWMKIWGESWYSARALSGAFAAGTGALLYWHLSRALGRIPALLACCIYSTSSMVLAECTTAKTYASSIFFTTWAFVLLEDGEGGSSARLPGWKTLALAGLLFGVAVNGRAPIAIALPAFLAHIAITSPAGTKVSRAAWFSLGFGAACVPSAILLFADPDSFWFNNLGYHIGRAGEGAAREQAERSRLVVARVAFGLRQSARFEALGYPLLVYGALLHALAALTRRSWPGLGFAIGATLFAGCFLPVPSYVQYLVVTQPFLLAAAMQSLSKLWSSGRPARVSLTAVLGVFFYLRAVTLPEDIERYTSTGERVIGIPAGKSHNWRLANVEETGKEIDRANPEREPVMAFWPGYLVSSDSPSLRGMENHFGVKYMENMPSDVSLFERYGIRSWDEIFSAIERREPAIVVYFHLGRRAVPKKLAEAGYKRAAKVADISILRREVSEKIRDTPRS